MAFGFNFGSKKSSSDQKSQTDFSNLIETEQTKNVETEREQTKTGTSQTEQQQQEINRLLSQEDLDLLSSLTQGLTGRIGTDAAAGAGTVQQAENLAQTGNLATANAANSGEFIDELVTSSLATAETEYNEGQVAQILQGAQEIGSLDNTISQQLLEKGRTDLSNKLGALEGDIRLKGEQLTNQTVGQATASAGAALSGGQQVDAGNVSGLNAILAALQVAKGGETTRDVSGTVNVQSEEQLDGIIRALEELTGVRTSTGTQSKTGSSDTNQSNIGLKLGLG